MYIAVSNLVTKSFGIVLFWVTSAQGLLLALCSGMTPVGLGGTIWDPRIEPEWVTCEAKVITTLAPTFIFFCSFLLYLLFKLFIVEGVSRVWARRQHSSNTWPDCTWQFNAKAQGHGAVRPSGTRTQEWFYPRKLGGLQNCTR